MFGIIFSDKKTFHLVILYAGILIRTFLRRKFIYFSTLINSNKFCEKQAMEEKLYDQQFVHF